MILIEQLTDLNYPPPPKNPMTKTMPCMPFCNVPDGEVRLMNARSPLDFREPRLGDKSKPRTWRVL